MVALDPKLKETTVVKISVDNANRRSTRPAFLEWDEAGFSGKLARWPAREEMSFPVTEQLIVEYYSK
jgi:small subunit ribosomal protein S4